MHPSFSSNIRLLILAATVLITGCETIVEIDMPEHEPRLVVNALYEAGRPAQIYVSHSTGSLSASNPTLVTDATVEIVPDDAPAQQAVLVRDTVYQTPGVLEAGRTYTLRVSAPGLDPVEATATTPHVLPASVTMERRDTTLFSTTRTYRVFTLHVPDPPNERNHYRLRIQRISIENGIEYVDLVEFWTTDPSITAHDDEVLEITEGDAEFRGFNAYFNDLFFDGRNHSLTVEIREHSFEDPLRPDPEVRYEVILEHLDEGFYEYRRTLDLQNDTGDNPFAEPVNVYSNIENGYGIFAGTTPMVFPFKIED